MRELEWIYNVLSKSVLTSFAASTFAGLSRFGLSDERREITLRSCNVDVSITRGLAK